MQQLIIYGTIEAVKHAKAAQLRYTPDPYDMLIPSRTPDEICKVFMLSAFLTKDVHIAAPIKTKIVDKMANAAEMKKRKVFLRTPVSNERNAKRVPSNKK